MRFSSSGLYHSIALILMLLTFPGKSPAAQAPLRLVTIQQISEVSQGKIREFNVDIDPEDGPHLVTLRLQCGIGIAKAVSKQESFALPSRR